MLSRGRGFFVFFGLLEDGDVFCHRDMGLLPKRNIGDVPLIIYLKIDIKKRE